MGVTGLWTVLKPCARPIKLETLNKQRLAVDASIWIYQFLKAVRDKEGNALRNAHIVGFFRRICKLLYFGIKPVFVFDGGAPSLKRQTIVNRQRRRDGRREDAARTATKLLAVQLQKQAEEEAQKRKKPQRVEPEEKLPEEFVYADETLMSAKERKQNRQFRKKDEYHLPDLDMSLEAMGAPNDPRIMSQGELEEYARQFHSGENINLYDFSKIDFDSPFFLSLPANDRYNILNAARLRSRLRMGYSKEQLDTMFPDRMAFSRFQIERVAERNDLTQRLMNINGMNGTDLVYTGTATSRIAGERDKEYILVKDDAVEGGWALGVLGNKEGHTANKPIDIDQYGMEALPNDEGSDDQSDDDFEEVPIEGLNRLPKLPIFEKGIFDESLARQISGEASDDGALFVEDTASVNELFEPKSDREDDESAELLRAIQLSLDDVPKNEDSPGNSQAIDVDSTPGYHPTPTNTRDKEISPQPASDDDNDMELFSALAKTKVSKVSGSDGPNELSHPFSGPLPFESFRVIGESANSKAPVKSSVGDDQAGGFVIEESMKGKAAEPLPPWFIGISEKEQFIEENRNDLYDGTDANRWGTSNDTILSRTKNEVVIDIDDDEPSRKTIINIDSPVNKTPAASVRTDSEEHEGEPNLRAPTHNTIDKPIDEEIRKPHRRNTPLPLSLEESLSPQFEDVDISGSPEEVLRIDENLAPIEATNQTVDQVLENNTAEFQEEPNQYSDPEEDELLFQLATEAEEHARFASTYNSKSQAENAFDYENELKQLRSQQKKDRRDADEVSQVMVAECQQLLRLFGLPYVTAPMEAEAQCAELVSLGLVDGIVTDDCDTFLFGGTRVYKNMFSQAKFVECYLSSDLEKEYTLDRQKLISFAHLLGSDYTEGIPGIGPVTALEILTEFSGLEEFRDWWSQVQRSAKIPDDPHATFRKKFKKNLTKLFLPPSFPDSRVDLAYMQPEVDPDPSRFQWGVPDLNAVRHFLMSTVGWSAERTDEVLVPVIRDANRREQEGTQSNITGFFEGTQGAGAFAPRRRADGKSRMEKAFSRLQREAEARQTGPNTKADSPTLPQGTDDSTAAATVKNGKRRQLGDGDMVTSASTKSNTDQPVRKKTKRKQKEPTT